MNFIKFRLGWILSGAYLLISAILISSLGIFGESFITVILGLPWSLPVVQFDFLGTSSILLTYIAALVPIALNAVLLYIIGAWFEKGRTLPAIILIATIVLAGCIYYIFASSFADQSKYILPESYTSTPEAESYSNDNRQPIFNPETAAGTNAD